MSEDKPAVAKPNLLAIGGRVKLELKLSNDQFSILGNNKGGYNVRVGKQTIELQSSEIGANTSFANFAKAIYKAIDNKITAKESGVDDIERSIKNSLGQNVAETTAAKTTASAKTLETTAAKTTASAKTLETTAAKIIAKAKAFSTPTANQSNPIQQALDDSNNKAHYLKSAERKQIIAQLWKDNDTINAFNASLRPNGPKLSPEMDQYIKQQGGIANITNAYKTQYNKSLSRDAAAFQELHKVDPNKNNSLTWKNNVGQLQNAKGEQIKWSFGNSANKTQQSDVMLSFRDERGNPAGPDKGMSSFVSFDKNGKISDMHVSGPLYGQDGTYISQSQLRNMTPADVNAAFGSGELHALRQGSDGKMQKFTAPFNANQLKAMYAERDGLVAERNKTVEFLADPATAKLKTVNIAAAPAPSGVKVIADRHVDIAANSRPVEVRQTAQNGQQAAPQNNMDNAPSQTADHGMKPFIVHIDFSKNEVKVGDQVHKLVVGKTNYITVGADGKSQVSTIPPANMQWPAHSPTQQSRSTVSAPSVPPKPIVKLTGSKRPPKTPLPPIIKNQHNIGGGRE